MSEFSPNVIADALADMGLPVMGQDVLALATRLATAERERDEARERLARASGAPDCPPFVTDSLDEALALYFEAPHGLTPEQEARAQAWDEEVQAVKVELDAHAEWAWHEDPDKYVCSCGAVVHDIRTHQAAAAIAALDAHRDAS